MSERELKGAVISIAIEILKFEPDFSSNFELEEGWDSLKMLNLILAIEEEFDFSFSSDEMEQLSSIEDIYKILVSNNVTQP